MRLLLDACVPQRLRFSLTGLDGLTDSALLDAMEGVFDVLVTCDQSIPWQQNLRARSIGVLLLKSPSNRLPDLLPLVPSLLKALGHIARGQVLEVSR